MHLHPLGVHHACVRMRAARGYAERPTRHQRPMVEGRLTNVLRYTEVRLARGTTIAPIRADAASTASWLKTLSCGSTADRRDDPIPPARGSASRAARRPPVRCGPDSDRAVFRPQQGA